MKTVIAACTALFACAGAFAAELTIDSKKEAAYICQSQGGTVKLNAMYGIKDKRVVVAQVKINNIISPGLFAQDGGAAGNRFVSIDADGTMWTTKPANGDTITQVDGGVLSVRQGKTNAVIVDNCKLDKAATAKLKPQ
ncbi:hypothetical protein [Conchiformibius kuhniae]|uniref:Adhesin n=1 Tax=Conchiformibius kuhniae TaxID=211502 RepID=A0A8T9MUX9_9NEIS|nr:hypothetical protein [Conchiformibius kuhniae]UOP04158.1 hypothetical protein LVJ77_06800 [Conchiformibius kuhniae]